MKAVVCKQLALPEQLVIEDLPTPKVGAADVLIRIAGADVNFPDVLIVQGKYQMKPPLPFIPGAGVAGTVVEVGDKVKHLKAGDPVAAFTSVGGFAEQVAVNGALCLPLPPGLDLVEAAAFPMVYGTSYHALKQRGRLQPGETLLVLGASGGVGLSAVQLGKKMGARVIAAASSADKLALAQAHGADELIDYSQQSLKDAIKTLTKGQGADVIYDPVGGALGEECLSCIAWNGRYLIIGFASGPIPNLAANRLLLKGASAVGVFWGAFAQREPQVNAQNFAELFAWYAAGEIKPVVTQRYPLDQAPQALRDMMERKVSGKIVIVP
ncbi:NADPH:quinone oxidoreductase family protein [Solimonas marina]|uniref:NADPH:quinone oxidoreductase family protein n=1 Tax=Solimonas marina TaxID=2714601 RepID=A0A969W8T6_9GAMM|nr:NADPH:quinone oxidoreductase family protein [Solimonas marina]NKF22826.1 NADPH:quinone oxidoreductase family protein [Solimonas marina]